MVLPSRHSQDLSSRRVLDSEEDCDLGGSPLACHADMIEYDLCDLGDIIELRFWADVRCRAED